MSGRASITTAAGPRHPKESLLVFEKHPDCRHAADAATVKRMSALAAYRLRKDGAQRLRQVEGAMFGVDLSPGAGPHRKLASGK
jgi:hypothetical protein